MTRRRNSSWLPVRCHCGKRVAIREDTDVMTVMQVMVPDHDMPWITCPQCRKSYRIEELIKATDERRKNGWER